MKNILLIALLLISFESFSQWTALPAPNLAVTNQAATTDASRYWATRDGVGGSYVVWEDDRNDPGNETGVFCQRVLNIGSVKFAANGITISDVAGSTQKRPWVSEGSNSSALIVWEDERNAGTTSDDIYAKSIDSTGATLWGGANGIVICNAAGKQERPQIVSDGAGGGIIVWRDLRGADRDMYAQRINSAGTAQWGANGIVLCGATDKQSAFHAIPDGAGGAIVAWEDDRSGSTTDIYAQLVNSAGVVQWGANGVAVCTNAADDQLAPQVSTDGSGGVIITWEDLRTGGTEDIYAQRVNAAGTAQWTADGVVICNAADVQAAPVITDDGAGGAVITWEDNRNMGTTDTDIYTQRVNSTGTVQWAANGVGVCTSTQRQRRVHSSAANNGAILVTWADRRNGSDDIYIEIIAADGTMSSGTIDGIQVTNSVETEGRPFIFDNGTSEWIVVWEDDRNDPGGNNDIYSQGLNSTILVALPIELLSFNAIPNEGLVEVNWETVSEINSSYFTLERSQDGYVWETISKTPGAGTSNSIIGYFEIDAAPLKGLSYYRLKQTDFDGLTSISNIVPVQFVTVNNVSMGVFPNPAKLDDIVNVNFEGLAGSEILVVLRDIRGQEVYSKLVFVEKDNEIITIDKTNTLSSGTYLVLASSENKLYSKKLIIE